MRHLVGSRSPHNKRVKKHVFGKGQMMSWTWHGGVTVLAYYFSFFLHLRSTSGTWELRGNCTADSWAVASTSCLAKLGSDA